MRKKKGNTLIEVLVAIPIICIMILIAVSISVNNKRISKIRYDVEEGNRTAFCIMQEIKYNFTIEEIINESNNGNLNFKDYDGFLDDLSEKSLLELQRGDNILINVARNIDTDKLNITIEVYDDTGKIIAQKEFIKYRWMEYYEKV